MEGYQYDHVPLSHPRSTRIIHLEPSTECTSSLRRTLTVISLDDCPMFKGDYIALSYSWDAQTPSSTIECDGKILLVTANCEAVLRRLRSETETEKLWIDSVCINQSAGAVEERNQQVAMMGDIYGRARGVAIWIGESDASTEKAIQHIKEIGDLPSHLGPGNKRALQKEIRERVRRLASQITMASEEPLGPLFERSWFHRMWTVQEVVLSGPAPKALCCGSTTLPWDVLLIAAEALESEKYRWGKWAEATRLTIQLTLNFFAARFPGVKRIIDDNPGDLHNDPLAFQILNNAREKLATNPKDKVFALYSILKELGVPFPAPDYCKPVGDVYRESVVATVNYDKNLYILYYVSSDNRRGDLASWVPDWSDAGWKPSDMRYPTIRDRFAACGPANARWHFSDDQKQMTITGKLLDSIVYRAEPLAVSENVIRACNDGTLGQGAYNPQLREEEFLRFVHSNYLILRTWVDVSRWSDYPTGESTMDALRRTLVQDDPESLAKDPSERAYNQWYHVMTADELTVAEIALKNTQPDQLIPTSPMHRETFLRACISLFPEAEWGFSALTSGLERSFSFYSKAIAFSQKKCFFYTEDGYFGTAPDPLPTPVEAGDRLAVVGGLEMPLLLRPVEGGYRLLTHVYVHGITYGEAWPENKEDLQEIVLV